MAYEALRDLPEEVSQTPIAKTRRTSRGRSRNRPIRAQVRHGRRHPCADSAGKVGHIGIYRDPSPKSRMRLLQASRRHSEPPGHSARPDARDRRACAAVNSSSSAAVIASSVCTSSPRPKVFHVCTVGIPMSRSSSAAYMPQREQLHCPGLATPATVFGTK